MYHVRKLTVNGLKVKSKIPKKFEGMLWSRGGADQKLSGDHLSQKVRRKLPKTPNLLLASFGRGVGRSLQIKSIRMIFKILSIPVPISR
jgi:hypothetical protein